MPALKRQGQEDGEFKDSLGYTARPCLKTNKQKYSKLGSLKQQKSIVS
jgi:hypothetical protein